MYDLVGDRLQEIFDAQVVDIGVLDREAGLIRFPYSIERGERFPDEPIAGHRLPASTSSRRANRSSSTTGIGGTDSREFGSRRCSQGEPPKSALFVPLVVGGQGDRRDLAPEPRPRARVQRGGRSSAHHARREPERRARERPAVRGDPPAQRRARAHQRRAARLAENLEMQAMYDLVGDRIQEIFDAQVVDIGILDRDDGLAPLPVLDRAWRAVPGRADAEPRASASTSSRRANRSSSTSGIAERCAPSSAAAVIAGRGRRSPRCSSRSSSAARRPGRISLQNLDREHAFSEADVRLLDDARRQPERRARERPAVRGDAAAQRRARADQRRPARPRREPRDAGDVRPRRRAHRADLRRADGRHRGRGRRPPIRSGSRTRSSAAFD